MVEYIKGLLGIGKPGKKLQEIVLIKNEPKHYYNNSLGKWVFEGEEDYLKDKRDDNPPPSKKRNDCSTLKVKEMDLTDTATRYKNFLSQSNIIQPFQSTNREEVNESRRIKEQETTITALRKEIEELKELIEVTDDKCNESQVYYKEELSKYVKDNLLLQENIDCLNQQLQQKDCEINKYQLLIAQYQELLKGSSILKANDYQMLLIEDNDQSFSFNRDKDHSDLLVNSKLEKLKSENMLLLNDIKKLQTDLTSTQAITASLNTELASAKEDIEFKEKHIALLEKKLKDHQCNSIESTTLLSKMNKLTGENILLKSQNEKQKTKLTRVKSQLDISQAERSKVVNLKKELFTQQSKLTDVNDELMNVLAFIKKECNGIGNAQTILRFLSSDCTVLNLLAIIKCFFKAIAQSRNELTALTEREGYLKKENDNFQLEIEIMRDQLQETNAELVSKQEQLKEVTRTNKDLNEKIREMMTMLTQTQNEFEKEKRTTLKLENQIKQLKQASNSFAQSRNMNTANSTQAQFIYKHKISNK